jgi:DNA-binding transcriptional regulator YhcF (GntR family)
MKIEINRADKTPVYIQIAGQIKNMLHTGAITDGYMLPSERVLAEELGVHRNTVTRAFMDLKSEGLIDARQGQGYRVRYRSIFAEMEGQGMKKKPVRWEALIEDSEVLVEEFIQGREFDCGVLRTKEQKYVFPVTEIIPTGGHEFFDYAAKYDGFSNEVTPAEVDKAVSDQIQEVSSKLYDLLDCRGIVRFDYIYDTQKQELFFLEVNTIPGQSAESIVPKQARAMGITTKELYEMVIQACMPQ